MKKSLLSLAVMAVALFMNSCSDNTFAPEPETNELAPVRISINVENNLGTKGPKKAPSMRAISDGTSVNHLVYAVFDKDGNRVSEIAQVSKDVTFPAQEELSLVKGQTYKIAFWAQSNKCTAYNTDDLTNVTVNYDGINNDETRDAFFKTQDITVGSNNNITVTLKRPFAQLNVGTSEADFNAAKATGIELKQSKVVIKNAANKINLITGKTEGDAAVTYTLADMPADKLSVGGTDYKYLSMSYFLVNDGSANGNNRATLTSAEVEMKTADGSKVVTLADGLNNIPVQRNYRTNILSENLLSDKVKVTIVVDSNFDGDEDFTPATPVKNSEELMKALEDGVKKISLADGDYNLGAVKRTNGEYTIIGASKNAKVKITPQAIAISGAKLTFKNLTLISTNANYVGIQHTNTMTCDDCVIENVIFGYSSGKTIFNRCTFTQTSSDFYNVWSYGADMDFNDCTFNCAGKALNVYNEGHPSGLNTVNFNNCTFNATVAKKAAIEIDPTFCKFNVNINNCTANGFANGSTSGNPLYNIKTTDKVANVTITVNGELINYPG